MNGELAQAIALATHGTAWLRDPAARLPAALAMDSSTFQYLRSVEFTLEERRWLGPRRLRATMPDVATWLERLRGNGIERLWLVIPAVRGHRLGSHVIDAHMLAGFAGGAEWLLQGTGRSNELWSAAWEVGAPQAEDNRIWDVRYHGVVKARGRPPTEPPIEAAADSLRSALIDVREFAGAHDLSPWTETFGEALDALEADAPEIPYHRDMVPVAYPRAAQRLLVAAAQSWVFGGMGSWNDLGFEDTSAKNRYQDLSRRLYSSMLAAFVAGVNVPDQW